MIKNQNHENSRNLTDRGIEVEYGLSVPWLRKRRRLRLPPRFLKIGRMIRYRREDIESFLDDLVVEPSGGQRQ